MRDLMIDFGDGRIRPLLEVTDLEFSIIVSCHAARVLILDTPAASGQNIELRLEAEKYIRGPLRAKAKST